MAHTLLSQVTKGGGGSNGTVSFYIEDIRVVENQNFAVSTGYVNVIFQNEELTVYAAQDGQGQTLNKLALPCPPHTPPKSFPGDLIL